MRIEHSPDALPVIELPHPFPIPCPEPYVPPDHGVHRILALAGFTPDQYQIDETIPYWFSKRISASNRITESDEAPSYGVAASAAYAIRTGETWTISQDGLSHLLSGEFIGSVRDGAFAQPVVAAMGAKDKIPELQKEVTAEQSAWEDAYRKRIQQFIQNLETFPAYRSLSPEMQEHLSKLLKQNSGIPKLDRDRLRAEWSNAEALNLRVERGEILTNWGGSFRITGSDNNNFWVIRADGTLRDPDHITYLLRSTTEGKKFWDLVEPEELALAWKKTSAAGPHNFSIEKRSVHGNSQEQGAVVQQLLHTIAEEWDGRVGMSGKSSPPVGKGWDFAAPKAPRPSLFRGSLDQREIPAPKSIEELRVLRATEAVRSARAAQEAEAIQQAQNAASTELLRRRSEEFTPETREALRQQHEALCTYFAISGMLPPTTEERKKFIATTRQYDVRLFYTDTLADFRGKAETERMLTGGIATLKGLAQRQKITNDVPNLWEKISSRVEQSQSIPRLVHEAALKHGDVTLLLGESIDGTPLTESLIAKRVTRRFLEDPWNITAAESLTKEVQELFTLLG